MSDLHEKFPGYPVVNIRSDMESWLNNKEGILGQFTTMLKKLETFIFPIGGIDHFMIGS